jgi:hypothetical protein
MQIPYVTEIKDFPKLIQYLVATANDIIAASTIDDKTVLGRYGAYGIDSFTNMMGWSLANARSELTRYTIQENLRCEKEQDHPGLLYDLLRQANAAPTAADIAYMEPIMKQIRDYQRQTKIMGLFGTLHFTMIENTSLAFVPDIGERAKRLGATDFLYINIHGDADAAHASAFINASMAEANMGYENYPEIANNAARLMIDILNRIYR